MQKVYVSEVPVRIEFTDAKPKEVIIEPVYIGMNKNNDIFESEIKMIREVDPNKFNKMAKKGEEHPKETITIIKNYKRSPYVKIKVKERANGYCELCGEKAPFITKNNEEYLEVHHLITLSNKGPDTLYNAVALCPNCHRELHFGNTDINSESYTKLVELIKTKLLEDNDVENIKKLEEYHDEKYYS